jgi:hypothetical protein
MCILQCLSFFRNFDLIHISESKDGFFAVFILLIIYDAMMISKHVNLFTFSMSLSLLMYLSLIGLQSFSIKFVFS